MILLNYPSSMMKIFTLFFAVLPICSGAQFLTQSGDGKGSFLFKGSNVGFDLAKTDISFTMNNLNRPVDALQINLNHRIMYGGSVNVKNQDGIGNLFSSGDFTPTASANVYGGYQFANTFKGDYDKAISLYSKKMERVKNGEVKKFINHMKNFLTSQIKMKVSNNQRADKIKEEWFEALDNKLMRDFQVYIQGYAVNDGDGSDQLKQKTLKEIVTIDEEIEKFRLRLQKKMDQAHDAYVKNNLWKLSLFVFTGLEGSSFKRLGTIDNTNFGKSFIAEDFRGSKTGFGVNYQINRWKFGTTYGYKITNNLANLSKKDYKIVTTTTSASQTLTQETSVSAYVGDYAQVELMELNIDAIFTTDLGPSAQAYALVNPYYRGNLYSRNQKLLPSTYSLGLGLHFFSVKSKFLGGLYVELPDVDNSIEKNKQPDEQNIRSVIGKLTFGVVAKFSINSFISSQ